MSFNFETPFLDLGTQFYTAMPPEGVTDTPILLHYNHDFSREIGLDIDPKDPSILNQLTGTSLPDNASPFAMVYSGHQFGHWAGQLGDGRAIAIGQHRAPDGKLWDIQLKGAGKTPYSRFGDGRAVLRSSIREYLCSEAMHHLGIPTTRVLSLIGTNKPVIRECIEPGAIISRISNCHIRFGHFEHFYYNDDHSSLKILADHVIKEYYPHLQDENNKYVLWFEELATRTAKLVAKWQSVGFCHGVLNTDNMSITGLTIDYGPFGFLEDYNPAHICNHTDQGGRYAYNQQPHIGMWNLYALANVLRPLADWEALSKAIEFGYAPTLTDHFAEIMRVKMGCKSDHSDCDEFWKKLLQIMAKYALDYTNTMRALSPNGNIIDDMVLSLPASEELSAWWQEYHQFMSHHQLITSSTLQEMKKVNPKYILRNWIAEKVIRAAEDHNDLSVLNQVFDLLKTPFDEHSIHEDYTAPAPEEFRGISLSCSS